MRPKLHNARSVKSFARIHQMDLQMRKKGYLNIYPLSFIAQRDFSKLHTLNVNKLVALTHFYVGRYLKFICNCGIYITG